MENSLWNDKSEKYDQENREGSRIYTERLKALLCEQELGCLLM